MVSALSVCALLCLWSIPAVAAEAVKIGVFDMQKIMRDSKKIATYRQTFAAELDTKRKLLEAKQTTVKQHEETLAAESPALSAKDRKTREDRLAAEVRELKRLRADLDVDLQKTDRALTQKVLVELTSVVEAVGEKEGYDLVFEKTASGVGFVKPRLDMTDKIISAYDSKKESPAGVKK